MKLLYKILIGLGIFALPIIVYGATVFNSNQVGTSPVNGYILQTNGTVSTWVPASSGTVSGGINGFVTRWASSTSLTIGILRDNGTVAGVNATSSTVSFNVQGSGVLNPFNVSSSSGTSLLGVNNDGNVKVGNDITFATGTTRKLYVVDQTTTNTGSSLWLVGGAGFGTGNGGDARVIGGLSTDNTGGTAYVTGGQSSNANGGAVTISGGQGAVNGGSVTIQGGDGSTGAGGNVILRRPNNGSLRFKNGPTAADVIWDISGIGSNATITIPQLSGTLALLENSQTFTGDKIFGNASATNFTLSNLFITPGMANGCLQVTSGVATSTGSACGSGGSGNSAWTIGSGLIYNATTTDNIGIGTSTPNYKLSVVGTAGNGNILNIASSTGTSIFRVFDGTQTYYPAMAGYAVAGAPWVYLNAGAVATPTYSFNGSQTTGMYMPSTDAIGFSTAATQRMTISSAGNVGINSSTPNQLLSVGNSVVVTSGGLVGIGTGNPTTTQSALLHINDPSYARIIVTASTSANQVVGFFDARADAAATSRWQMGTKSNHSMVLFTNDAARLGIWASGGLAYGSTYSFTNDPGANTAIFEGTVGIGTTTPAYKLTVVGTAGNNPVLNIASSTGTSLFHVGANGKVGIGTTTPQGMLDILDLASNTQPSILYIGGTTTPSTTKLGCIALYDNSAKRYVYQTWVNGAFTTSTASSICQ